MLRRQRDSAGVLRGLFIPKSHSRNLSTASVLRADEKTVVREREGFLGWLKGIFNKAADKSNEDRRSHEVAAEIVDRALQRDHPEIAVPEVVADPSRKVDVVNQKLADFGAAESTTKFGDRKFRFSVGQRDTGECGSTNTIQQLAIYAESSNGVDSKEQKTGETPERGRDSSSRLALPDEIHRAERIGRSAAIEFAARDDLDVAAHYCCYTSPRHCYRLPRTRQPPLLLATYGPNRNMSVPTRAIAACAVKNSKPPIREPNMPEKREKKDEKKRDKKKEPVIRTERESIDSSESRAAMVAEDNPTSDPDAPFRYEWGVKLAEEEPAGTSDNDNLAEKGQRYVTKQLWGVNLTHSKPDVEDATPSTSESLGRDAREHRNASRVFEDTAAEAGETKDQVLSKPRRVSASEQAESSLKAKDDESLLTWTDRDSSSASANLVSSQQETSDANLPPSSQALRRFMRAMPGMSRQTIAPDDDYNVSEEATSDAEISAWRSLAMKSKPAMLAILSAARPEKSESMSIRPEAPQPKLDVRVVRSVEDIAEDNKNEQSAGFKLSCMGLKHVGLTETPNLDNFSPNKKMHTASALRDLNDIVRRGIGMLPVNSGSFADGSTRVKDLRITSAFSTNFESSQEEKTSDNVSNQQDGQQADLDNLNEEKSNSLDTRDSLESTEQILSPAEFQSSNDNQKQLDTEANVTETTNTVTDEETEISTRQSQDANRESVDRSSTSMVEESRVEDKNIRSETERESYEDSYTNYNRRDSYDVDHNVATIDSDPNRTKSHEVESTEEAAESIFVSAKNTVPDFNAEDASDGDFGAQYVTDGDYARIPGDPYPYNKENLTKWRMPASRSFLYAPIKRQTFLSGPPRDRLTPRNANDVYANAAGQSYGSHAAGTVMETSGSGDGAMGTKNVGLASGFRASSRDQRVVAPDYDAVDALGLQGLTEAFSRLDNAAAATTNRKTSEAERGDNASLRAYHQ